MLHNIYLFDRQGTCLFYHEWYRPKPVTAGAGTAKGDQRMMFGLFWTLKTFVAAMDPTTGDKQQLGAFSRIGEACSLSSYRTNNYKLHFHESASGIKIVLNTDPGVGDLREQLAYIYGHIFVECVMKNPAYTPGQPFRNQLFLASLNQYLKSLGI